jgi:hypothetical protein
MFASAAWVMDVVERSARAVASLHNRVGFLTAAVALTIGDAGFGRCACMVRFVVLNFLCHVQFPFRGGFEGYECAARSIFDRGDLESWSNWPGT